MRAASRPLVLGPALCALVLTGCGAADPAPLQPAEAGPPADLCETIPAAQRRGLQTEANGTDSGTPTAACSLRSPVGSATQRQVVVTWLRLDDDLLAQDVWASQCRSIDGAEYRRQRGVRVEGADKTCAGSARGRGEDAATLASVSGREVLTVRVTSSRARGGTALAEGTAMLEGVLAALDGQPEPGR